MKALFFIIISFLYLSTCTNSNREVIYDLNKISDNTFFKEWLLLGPFPNSKNVDRTVFKHGKECKGFFTDYLISQGGEKKDSPINGDEISYDKLNISRTWQHYSNPHKIISLNTIYPQSDQIISYAFCKIYSPDKHKMILSLGSNDGIQVFLNGKKIHTAHPKNGRRVTEDEDLIPIKLRKGENRLLLKIENGFGDYGFIVRLLKENSPIIPLIKQRGKSIELSTGDIRAIFIDNYPYGSNHLSGYNGIAELYHTKQDTNLFVPYYAGFNLEHIFGGDSLPVIFEPRLNPMVLKKISENEVLLHQPETAISHCESWTTFKIVKPHYIDISFRCVIHSAEFFKHDYAGLFWASYINAPADKKIYFLEDNKWIGTYSTSHGSKSTHLSENDHHKLYMAHNFNVGLAKTFSNHRFDKPLYFGRFKNMVIAYFFSTSKNEIIRFSQSPTGAGPKNPAWDFQFIIPDYKIGEIYKFSARLMYKEFKNNNNVLSEYTKWKEMKHN